MSEGSWVGLDVHARATVAGVLDGASGELRLQRVSPRSEETVAWLSSLPQPVRVAYEAGPTGYGLARACTERHGLVYEGSAWTLAHDAWLRRQRFRERAARGRLR